MSRVHSNDNYHEVLLWRANLRRQLAGRRGQQLLRELLAAIDALPEKKLGTQLYDGDQVCSFGAVALQRRVAAGEEPQAVLADLQSHNDEADDGLMPDWAEWYLQIPPHMAWEIPFVNDNEYGDLETPEQRWIRVRAWICANLKDEASA